jgi:hypothetical protein
MDLNEAIKNVHIVLGEHRDLFENSPKLKELMTTLDHYVMSSGAIKMGVIANGSN